MDNLEQKTKNYQCHYLSNDNKRCLNEADNIVLTHNSTEQWLCSYHTKIVEDQQNEDYPALIGPLTLLPKIDELKTLITYEEWIVENGRK